MSDTFKQWKKDAQARVDLLDLIEDYSNRPIPLEGAESKTIQDVLMGSGQESPRQSEMLKSYLALKAGQGIKKSGDVLAENVSKKLPQVLKNIDKTPLATAKQIWDTQELLEPTERNLNPITNVRKDKNLPGSAQIPKEERYLSKNVTELDYIKRFGKIPTKEEFDNFKFRYNIQPLESQRLHKKVEIPNSNGAYIHEVYNPIQKSGQISMYQPEATINKKGNKVFHDTLVGKLGYNDTGIMTLYSGNSAYPTAFMQNESSLSRAARSSKVKKLHYGEKGFTPAQYLYEHLLTNRPYVPPQGSPFTSRSTKSKVFENILEKKAEKFAQQKLSPLIKKTSKAASALPVLGVLLDSAMAEKPTDFIGVDDIGTGATDDLKRELIEDPQYMKLRPLILGN